MGESDKFNQPDDGGEVEAHKFDPTEAKQDKFENDSDDDVEAHKFDLDGEKTDKA
jgi:hypothetical protein